MAAKKGGLGRGLEALFNENAADGEGAVNIRLSDIEPNREQPRKDFDEDAISELAESIKQHGLIQPIVVRPLANGSYSIIAGERRWRACREAGLDIVPVVIKDVDERTVKELALIENLQRLDLNPIEEALGYKSLVDTYSLTQEEVAKTVGKSRSTVTNALRLLLLNEKETEALKSGKISAGHARALLSIEDTALRKEAFSVALNGGSVRDIENLSKKIKSEKSPKKQTQTNNYYREVELALKEELGRKVNIKPTKNGGTITLEFYSDEELADLAEKIAK